MSAVPTLIAHCKAVGLVWGLDPGTSESAIVRYDPLTGEVDNAALLPNAQMCDFLQMGAGTLVIEKVESYGMAVGAEVFETVFWSGRFAQAWGWDVHRLGRRDIKLHLCGSARAKDSNIRQALIDKFGGKAAALGTKAAPGPLYGLKSHLFAALAVAVTWSDLHGKLVGE